MSEEHKNTEVEEAIPAEITQALSFSIERNGRTFRFEPRRRRFIESKHDEADRHFFYPALSEDINVADLLAYYGLIVPAGTVLDEQNDTVRTRLYAKHCADTQGWMEAATTEGIFNRDRFVQMATEVSVLRETKADLLERRRKLGREAAKFSDDAEKYSASGDDVNFKVAVSKMMACIKQQRAIDVEIERKSRKTKSTESED